MFTFRAHPAMITVTEGIQDGFRYLWNWWRLWLPLIAVVWLVGLVVYAIVDSIVVNTDFRSLYYTDPFTNRLVFEPDAANRFWSLLLAFLAVGLLQEVLSLVASWVFYATAISGLRNRPVTIEGVIGRGLLSLVSGVLIGVAIVVAFVVAVVAVIAVLVASPPLGGLLLLVLIFGGVPVLIYLEIRLFLTSMAVFDGFGPIEGIRESWRLSDGSVLRMFGWGLMTGLIVIALGIVASIVALPFVIRAHPVGEALALAIGTTASGLAIFITAVLYESQRARMDPSLYGPPPVPTYAWGSPYGPGTNPGGPYPGGPQAGGWGPSAPGQYPGGPYAGGPYAGGPYAGGPYAGGPYPGGWGQSGPAPSVSGPYPGGPYPGGPGQYPGAPNPWGAPAPGPYAAGPYAPPTGPYPLPPAGPAGSGFPYQNSAPGYPTGQPPRWQTPATGTVGSVDPGAVPGRPAGPEPPASPPGESDGAPTDPEDSTGRQPT